MKKSRESSHYFSRQYPRRRQIRLPARLQISGTMTMPHGSSRWEHTMGAALCSGHGRRRLHVRQRQTPRSAGETSRAVFSSAPIAVFLIQKEKILEIVRFQGFFCRVSTEKMPFAHHLLYRSEIFFLISGVITFLYCCAISQNWIFSSSVTSFFLHRVLNKVGFPPRKIYRRLSGI